MDSSEPAGVVQVSRGGVIDGLQPGKAVVTAAAPWGKSAAAEVFVVEDLFLSSNRGGGFGIYQLRSAVADTLQPVLADSFANIQPALSPDRTRIAFSSNRDGSYDLYLMDADGGNLRRLTTDPGTEGEPVWTPDGSRVVYTATPKGGQPQIYALGADGKPAQALTAAPGANQSPAISADGQTLAFVSTRDGNQEIYLMPVGGGDPRRVTQTERPRIAAPVSAERRPALRRRAGRKVQGVARRAPRRRRRARARWWSRPSSRSPDSRWPGTGAGSRTWSASSPTRGRARRSSACSSFRSRPAAPRSRSPCARASTC